MRDDRELGREYGSEPDDERGDVPGWVLVTLMTSASNHPTRVACFTPRP